MMQALLDHLWQSTAFAALMALLTLAFRENRAGVRFWLWFAASAKFLSPPPPWRRRWLSPRRCRPCICMAPV